MRKIMAEVLRDLELDEALKIYRKNVDEGHKVTMWIDFENGLYVVRTDYRKALAYSK